MESRFDADFGNRDVRVGRSANEGHIEGPAGDGGLHGGKHLATVFLRDDTTEFGIRFAGEDRI